MKTSRDESAEFAKLLMQEFTEQTGLSKAENINQDRYLWTDAFAVQNFLALSSYFDDDMYKDLARDLIDNVHYTLGRFDPDDSRSGWISQLPEEEGRKHPTIRGLRIGKEQPERKKSEPFDADTEWDKDGQYFHYHTRWIHALLQAADYLESKELIKYAAELSLAGRHFLQKTEGRLHLYWKMSVTLSYPQVLSMGAHDSLDGYLAALECEMMSSNEYDFTDYLKSLEKICDGKSWQTVDPLGLGGLFLNTVRSSKLDNKILPKSVKPQALLKDALRGLAQFEKLIKPTSSAKFRLAFRECGLSLGLRVIDSYRETLVESGLDINGLDKSLSLAGDIEDFWTQRKNRDYSSYRDHLNINHVSLASSLLARVEPAFFSTPLFASNSKSTSM